MRRNFLGVHICGGFLVDLLTAHESRARAQDEPAAECDCTVVNRYSNSARTVDAIKSRNILSIKRPGDLHSFSSNLEQTQTEILARFRVIMYIKTEIMYADAMN